MSAVAVSLCVVPQTDDLRLIAAATRLARTKFGRLQAPIRAAEALNLAVMLAEAKYHGDAAGDWPTQSELAAYLGRTGGTERTGRTIERWFHRYRELFGEDAEPRTLAESLLVHHGKAVGDGDVGLLLSARADLYPGLMERLADAERRSSVRRAGGREVPAGI